MSARRARVLVWLCWVATLALAVAGTLLEIGGGTGPGDELGAVESVPFAVALLAFGSIGVAVVRRKPTNVIGWVFLGIGFSLAAFHFLDSYARARPVTSGQLSPPVLAAWLASVVSIPTLFGLIGMLLLLFPDGRPPSPHWRLVAWAGALGLSLVMAGEATQPGPLSDFETISNPFAAPGFAPLATPINSAGWALLFGSVLASGASLIVRLRRARGEARQQLKWFVYGAALAAILLPASNVLYYEGFTWGVMLMGLALAFIPILAGVAILKYRLYDIDVLINRTLVYVALTATLALAYFGLVVLLQQLLAPLTPESDLAIAGSTLAVAALFRPARSRIQAFIDRRFYRRKYDAAKTLEAFSSHLRNEIDLETLGSELLGVVRQTMQPAHVSLWLKEPMTSPRRTMAQIP